MNSPTTPVRARRLGLYGPLIALAIAAVAWSLGWLWLKGEVGRRLDAARQSGSGAALTWTGRRVYGYPFRLDVDFTGVSWREPTGWGLTAPTLKTETFVFAPGHWMAIAPDGVILSRPEGGDVRVTARVLRASLSGLDGHPPTFSLEGLGLAFTPVAGASPYFLRDAAELHAHTRAGPADQGAFYVELDRATANGALGQVAAGKPVNVIADAIYSHAGALAGPSWASAIGAWSGAGGQINLRRIRLVAGETTLDAHGATLSIDGEGRLAGALVGRLSRGAAALTALSEAGIVDPAVARTAATVLAASPAGAAEPVTLDFQAGRTTLGPVAVGASPKVY